VEKFQEPEQKEQGSANDAAVGAVTRSDADAAAPRAQIYEVQDGDRNSNAMYQGGDRSQGKAPGHINMYEQRLKGINKQIAENRAFNQENAAREIELQRHQDQEALSYDDEHDDDAGNSGPYRNDGGDPDESADMDQAITERNQQTQRDRLGDYARDQDASQA